MTDPVADERQQQLEQWLELQLGQKVSGVSASSDASFRRYFRYQLSDRSVIAMDAPPVTEDCRPFVKIAGLLASAGVCVPDIIAQDLDRGFLLLSDLGEGTYLDVMSRDGFSSEQADTLFAAAIDTLLRIQQINHPERLPHYDEPLLRRELELFSLWYVERHMGCQLDKKLGELLDSLYSQLTEQILSQAKTFVHRDYMPRNLMPRNLLVDADGLPTEGKLPGVLDFQDAVYGPISYDASCLFKDAFISWPEERVESWLNLYWSKAIANNLPVPETFCQFQRDCDFMGVHRHLKVIGIFARICHRDGKPKYLSDVPRFFDYLHTVARRRPELSGLMELLVYLEDLQHSSENSAK